MAVNFENGMEMALPLEGGGGGGAVSSVFGRTGAVTATSGDYAVADITGLQTALDAKVTAGSASLDNQLVRYHLTTGTIVQNTGIVVDDSNNMTGIVGITCTGNITLSTAGATVDGVDLTALNTTVGTNTTNISSNTSAIALKADLSQAINTQSGTTYTIQASDNGKLIRFTNAAAVTVTVPDTIVPSAGTCFLCNCSQETAAGQITFVGSGTMSGNVVHPGLTLKSRAQNSEVSLRIFSATSARVGGDLAAV